MEKSGFFKKRSLVSAIIVVSALIIISYTFLSAGPTVKLKDGHVGEHYWADLCLVIGENIKDCSEENLKNIIQIMALTPPGLNLIFNTPSCSNPDGKCDFIIPSARLEGTPTASGNYKFTMKTPYSKFSEVHYELNIE